MVRDSVLRSSGLLADMLGGPSVFPPQPPGVTTEGTYGELDWSGSPGRDRFRRGLYTFSKRTAPFAMVGTFDGPSGEVCVARREVSNTPLQSADHAQRRDHPGSRTRDGTASGQHDRKRGGSRADPVSARADSAAVGRGDGSAGGLFHRPENDSRRKRPTRLPSRAREPAMRSNEQPGRSWPACCSIWTRPSRRAER